MKIIRSMLIVVFAVLLLLPVVFFNFKPDAVSMIDNRKLAENPLTADGDLTKNIDSYISDRIGFRDKLISAYTIGNDKLFGKMVHPSYSYGKDGYVFGSGLSTENNFGEYHKVFADMVKSVQDYCQARGVPFLFVFNPAKPAVYQDKISNGVNYNRQWVKQFFAELDARGINYLDNTVTLQELRETGIDGFNQKYDANHWNDTGAFYGTQKMLERMQELYPKVYVNRQIDFTPREKLMTSLQVSNFPIHEYVPNYISNNTKVKILTSQYSGELTRNKSFTGFGYMINEAKKAAGSPKTLVFQGSYMNSYGMKYLMNALGEYIYVHDYQNVINFPYYFNIFQPECVIFEVAEYTLKDGYFSLKEMKKIDYNPSLTSVAAENLQQISFAEQDVAVTEGNMLVTIEWKTDAKYKYVWLEGASTFDMSATKTGYKVVIEKAQYEAGLNNFQIFALQ